MSSVPPSSPRHRFLLLGALLTLIVAGVVAQVVIPRLYPATATVPLPLADLLPKQFAAWETKDLPLAETENLQATVSKILRYDDTLFRIYTKGDLSFGVYLSYWKPGKVSYYDAGVHTPDTCWVYNGWKRESREHAVTLNFGREVASKPAEVGVFVKDRTRLHVAFWHLVGGQVTTYEQYSWNDGLRGHLERFPNYLRDLLRFGFNQGQEQCFVRISSAVPMPELMANPEVAQILRSLAPLGLFVADRPASPPAS